MTGRFLLGIPVLLCLFAIPAAAQAPSSPVGGARAAGPLVRGDVFGLGGWHHVQEESAEHYDDWDNGVAGITGGVGWYWTDHLKTEVEFGATSEGRFYRSDFLVIDGRSAYGYSDITVSATRFAVSQQYQFFRNAWFHPHLSAGVELAWERRFERQAPVTLFNPPNYPVEVRPAGTVGPLTTVVTRPFVGGGFKAYMTPRTFFRSDIRVGWHEGADHVALRVGFGVDF